jgi:hypothetical protein
MLFDLRTATDAEMIDRAEYLEAFPARGRYRAYLHAEAAALRQLAGRAREQTRESRRV